MDTNQHSLEYTVTSPALRAKIGAAVVSGCLALAMVPAVAFADVAAGSEGGQGGGQPPAMEQQNTGGPAPAAPNSSFSQAAPPQNMPAPEGTALNATSTPPNEQTTQATPPQAPNGQNAQMQEPPAAPSGTNTTTQPPERPQQTTSGQDSTNSQTPNPNQAQNLGQAPASGQQPDNAGISPNQQMGGNDPKQTNDQEEKELRDKIIAAIPDDDIRAKAEAGNPDTENKRPAIPEGELNIQQLIDTIRDALLSTNENGTATAGQARQDAGFVPGFIDSNMQGNAEQPPAFPLNQGEKPADTTNTDSTAENASEDANQPSDTTTTSANETADNTTATPGDTRGDRTDSLPLFQKIVETVLNALRTISGQ